MASYVPPHKRLTNGLDKSTPTPAVFVHQFKKKLNFGSSNLNTNKGQLTAYSDGAVSRLFALGVDDDDKIPPYVHLKPVPMQLLRHMPGERPLALVKNQTADDNCKDVQKRKSNPWECIAVNIWRDLLSSYDIVRREVESNKLGEVRPILVARIGNVLFRQNSFGRLKTSRSSSLFGSTLEQLKRSFCTNLPLSYVENIMGLVVPKIGVDLAEEKDIYHIKLLDKTRPEATISCKCRVNKDDGKLKLYKIELNNVRQLVVDVLCILKDLDLRLMLCTKKTVPTLIDAEEDGIRSLVYSAILDPNIMGGLRWPLGKASVGDRFTVVGVWHTVTKTYTSSSMKVKVRQADRYDFRLGTGEASGEVILKLKGVAKELKENQLVADSVSNELEDALKIIWEHFLDCDHSI